MQKFFAVGRLGRDPECRTSQSDMKIARFSLAIDRMAKKGEERKADFINCVAFDKKADFAETYLKKGTKIIIEAHVQVSNYTDKDGNKRTSTDFIIDNMEFAESKATSETHTEPAKEEPADDGFVNVPDGIDEDIDSLPFD